MTKLAFVTTVLFIRGLSMEARAQSSSGTEPKPSIQMIAHQAKGTFEISTEPLSLSDGSAGDKLARMSLEKQFAGDLVGTSKGEMLSARTEVKGSAGYVAIEKVVGTLNGLKGSFVLQHSGTMARGTPQATITVVPDSGTEGLKGIMGTFRIEMVEGQHTYHFEYSLPQ